MTAHVAADSREALRRYPALVWLVGASALALLLPSGLTVLQSGPPTLAEFAPVPGEGQGTSDVGELGQASSGGLGFGSGNGGGQEAIPEELSGAGGRVEYRPGTKRCVRHPDGVVRQTEDPLSPPCIAFFEGDNFGATAKGVTGDEVTVIVQTERTQTDSKAGQVIDCADPPADDDVFQDVVCKAYMRYFNDRYQTYGRVVHLYSTHTVSVPELEERFGPFAFATFEPAREAFAKSGIYSVGAAGSARKQYVDLAPLLASFRPDIEDTAATAASFICNRLQGRSARYAGDPALRSAPRRFAYWLKSSTGPDRYEQTLLSTLEATCGLRITEFGGGTTDSGAGARLRSAGITTVLTNVGNGAIPAVTGYATQAGWFPEWVVPAVMEANGLDVNFSARFARPEQWANAFGITVDYRRDALIEQPWYRAYREACGSCPEPTIGQTGARSAAFAYDSLSLLFYGIQAAGPRLTHANIDKGLHAIPPNGSSNPYKPAAYFAPGNYSFIKDAMAIWWDPAGQPPGSAGGGCYRLPDEGSRRRAGEWPAGDGTLKSAGPCQGETFQG